MEQLLSNNRQKLQAAIPLINNYNDRFDDLNHWWGKISLIGKINSHNVSDSILEEMLSTKEKFSELQGRLIQNLMKEHLLKRLADDHNKSQVAIDILIRNLFERTADVGFLATDDDIRAFLLHTDRQVEDIENIRHRLAEYVKKYSVYDEIVLLDTQGRVKANLDIDSSIEFSEDPLISKTLASTDDYTETFRYSDLQPHKRNSLIYSCVIKESNEKDAKALGVLCLCFKFDDEMQSIFSNLQSERAASSIMILSESREVMATSHSQKFKVGEKIPNSGSPDLITIKNKSYISTTSETKGYQGFKGLSWQGVAMTPLNDAFKHSKETGKPQTDSCQLLNSQLFSDDLKQIFKTSMLINDDLSLVVLNGIIAAARNNAVEFMPVLSEIKSTGESIALIFSDSIDNLQSTVISARLGDVRFCASLAVDIMDRNLYERANDCRWWALTTVFRQYLQLPTVGPDAQQEISNILGYINDLYTVYTNLYVYDKNGIIVAVSNKDHASVIGDKVDTQSGAIDALSCTDSQKYSVSKFVPSAQYDNKHTYIYNASITSLEQNNVVGGMGIVFDSGPQFTEMLDDSLPKDESGHTVTGCFGMFCQRDGMIISATEGSPQQVGDVIEIDDTLLGLKNGEKDSRITNYQGKKYAIGIAASKGYREYKTTGDYQNDVVAFIMMPS
ncbi:MAG: hypothetical protein COB03_05010 [Alteromonas sp.]|uniref:hypothetical protein n=1 Tax=uncultured Alteromonas sp. TaxID=179113 RepID=UPI000C0CCA1C|nr:MAG: hypothetical protein COB03_05010 [Alteromonas sp.]